MLFSFSKNRNTDFATFLFIIFLCAYFLCLIYLAHYIDIWEDEAYSLNTTSRSFSKVIKQSYDFEGQPPFYFLLLAIWRLIHPGVFFAKLLSILFTAVSALYMYYLTTLFLKSRKTYWIVVIFLLNPFTVWASLEIRLYSLVILLSVSSLYYFLKYFKDSENRDLIILLALCLIGLYTQYFFAFLMVSYALSLLIFKNWKACFIFCIYSIPVLLLFLPNLFFLTDQISMAEAPLYSLKKRILALAFIPQDFLLAFNFFSGGPMLRWIIKIPFGILLLYGFYKILERKTITFKNETPLLVKTLVFVLITLILQFIIVFISLKLFYQNKYLTVCFPVTVLLFCVFYAFSNNIKNVIFTLVSIFFVSLMVVQYQYSTKTYDFKTLSEFIDKNAKENEPILFFGKSIIPPFEYYYKNTNPIFGLPPLHYDKNYYYDEIRDTTEFKNAIRNTPISSKTFLLVLGSIRGYKYQDQLSPENIQNVLRSNYSLILDTLIKSKNSDNTLRIQRLIQLD